MDWFLSGNSGGFEPWSGLLKGIKSVAHLLSTDFPALSKFQVLRIHCNNPWETLFLVPDLQGLRSHCKNLFLGTSFMPISQQASVA